VRSERDVAVAQRAGAHRVVVTGGRGADEIVELVRAHSPDGVDHVVEVAFDANVSADERLLKLGGSIATYATGDPAPAIPFWPLVFKNRLFAYSCGYFSQLWQHTGEDFQTEVLLIPEAVGAPLDGSDLVVDALDEPQRHLVPLVAIRLDTIPMCCHH